MDDSYYDQESFASEEPAFAPSWEEKEEGLFDDICSETTILKPASASRVDRIRTTIEKQKHFYFDKNNMKKYSLVLKGIPISYYKKWKGEIFVCQPYKNIFENETDLVILLTQIVNEKNSVKYNATVLHKNDIYLRAKNNAACINSFKHYCSVMKFGDFVNSVKEETDKFTWLVKMHKKRIQFLYQLIVKIDNCFLNDHLKSINTYDDVFNYCLKNDKVYKNEE